MASGITREYDDGIGHIARAGLRPRTAWRAIEIMPIGVGTLVSTWLLPFAAIGPLAQLTRRLLFGFSGWQGVEQPSVTVLIAKALAAFATDAVVPLALVPIVAALARVFGGAFSPSRAAKLVVVAAVPVGLGGLALLYPPLAAIQFVALVYALYLFWIGLSVMLRVPDARVPAMFVVTLMVAVGLRLIAGTLAATLVAPAVPLIGG